MTPKVSELIDELYLTHKTKKAVQILFIDRAAESVFARIGFNAVIEHPDADGYETRQELIWLGYELAVDSPRLTTLWR